MFLEIIISKAEYKFVSYHFILDCYWPAIFLLVAVVNLHFESRVISIYSFAFFLLNLMPHVKNVLTVLTIVFEGFEDFVEFHLVARFSPGKCFVNFSSFFFSMSEHYSDFDCIGFLVRLCSCQEPL